MVLAAAVPCILRRFPGGGSAVRVRVVICPCVADSIEREHCVVAARLGPWHASTWLHRDDTVHADMCLDSHQFTKQTFSIDG